MLEGGFILATTPTPRYSKSQGKDGNLNMTKFRISKKSEEFAYRIPKTAQQTIPIRRIHKDGIWEVGNKFSRTWRFSDINFAVADDEDKRSILMLYCALEKALPTDAITQISVSNRRLNPDEFQKYLGYSYEMRSPNASLAVQTTR